MDERSAYERMIDTVNELANGLRNITGDVERAEYIKGSLPHVQTSAMIAQAEELHRIANTLEASTQGPNYGIWVRSS